MAKVRWVEGKVASVPWGGTLTKMYQSIDENDNSKWTYETSVRHLQS